jgi:hypothetical protein
LQDLLLEHSATRVHVELYRELQRAGASRCVIAALKRFALTAHFIRPTKCRSQLMSDRSYLQ